MAAVSDRRVLFSGTVLNAVGLVAGVAAAFAVQVLLGRANVGLGLVTVAVQAAFVAAAGSRFGMDLAALREVAIGRGAGRSDDLRSLVDRCAAIAFAASTLLALLMAAASPLAGSSRDTLAIAAASLPFAAAATVYLGATRGLKQMGPTLYVFWIGQPVAWIGFAAAAIAMGGRAGWAVTAYDGSWIVSALAARILWRRSAAGIGDRPASPERVRQALRFGLPRAPSAVLAQALFWGDLWTLEVVGGHGQLDTYAAVGRVSQVILLFLTSVNLVFSPFAADLHARGRREQLDALFKSATRWALLATLPLAIVLFVAAPEVLRAFGPTYPRGDTALRILLAGQVANVATGSVGFVLIMVGRTGLDLLDNALANLVLIGLAVPLAWSHGMEGAAVAAAVSLAGVNGLRLVQVRRLIGIQPYSRDYLRLLAPAAGCTAAALAAHAALAGSSWWLSLAATAAAGLVAFGALLPVGLPAAERAAGYRLTRRITNRESR